jgi:hypothetical protein
MSFAVNEKRNGHSSGANFTLESVAELAGGNVKQEDSGRIRRSLSSARNILSVRTL